MTLMKLLIEILFSFKFDQLKACIHYSLVIIIGLARIYNLVDTVAAYYISNLKKYTVI